MATRRVPRAKNTAPAGANSRPSKPGSNQGYNDTTAYADTNKELEAGHQYGEAKADEFYGPDNLAKTQISSGRSAEDTGIINQFAKANETAGQRSGETSDYLGRLQNTMNTAGQRSQQTTDLLGNLNQRAMQSGQISPDAQKYLGAQWQIAQNGYTAPQFQSMYEGLNTAENQKNAQTNYDAQVAAANSGLRGAAANAQQQQLLQKQMLSRNDLNTKLSDQALTYQTGALNQYGTSLNQFQNAAADQANQAWTNYGNTLDTAQTNEFKRGQTATDAYGTALTGAQKSEYDRQVAARTAYANQVQGAQTKELDAQKYNIDAYNTNQAGRAGAVTGGEGAYLSTLQGSRANQINNGAVQWAKQKYAG